MTMTSTVRQPDAGSAHGRTPDELLASARELAPQLREASAGHDAAGILSEPIVDALHAHGLFGMWTPASLGGAEADPITSLRIGQTLAEADPSCAWVVGAAALAIGTGGAYLADAAVEQVFAGPRFPVIAGQGTRPGTAVVDGDGHRLSGAWAFGSGLRHSQWIHTLGVVESTGEARIFVLPVEQAQLIDNWDVLGLRATASIDYTIDDVYVPEAFSHPATTETPLRGGPLFGLGIIHLALIVHSGWALGVSRRMLDELAGQVRAKAGRPGTLAENPRFHASYGELEGSWHAAHAFVHQVWSEISDAVASGERPTHDQRTRARLALHHATWAAERISVEVYQAGGTTALRSGALQQYFRDMHAGSQHFLVGPGTAEACGRALAGLADGHTWLFMSLVPPG